MPFQNGAREQVIAARVRNGPWSSTSTSAAFSPRPETVRRSKSRDPGRTTRLETFVTTFGAAFANVVSAASPQAVSTPSYASVGDDRLAVGVVAGRPSVTGSVT